MRAFLSVAAQRGAKVSDPDLALRAVARMASALEAKAKRTRYSSTAEIMVREGLEAVGVRLPDKTFDEAMQAYYRAVSAVVTPIAGDAVTMLQPFVRAGPAAGAGVEHVVDT